MQLVHIPLSISQSMGQQEACQLAQRKMTHAKTCSIADSEVCLWCASCMTDAAHLASHRRAPQPSVRTAASAASGGASRGLDKAERAAQGAADDLNKQLDRSAATWCLTPAGLTSHTLTHVQHLRKNGGCATARQSRRFASNQCAMDIVLTPLQCQLARKGVGGPQYGGAGCEGRYGGAVAG